MNNGFNGYNNYQTAPNGNGYGYRPAPMYAPAPVAPAAQ